MRKFIFSILITTFSLHSFSQDTSIIQVDTIPVPPPVVHMDTVLKIVEFNPYFSLHVDSALSYQMRINKNPNNYYWYMKNAPVGLRITKGGEIRFKADKSYFLSGKLKYDQDYRVLLGVQNLEDPSEKIDTSFTITFYNTEVLPSRVKPSISNTVNIEEGDRVNFKVFCEDGSFPIETITTQTTMPISNYHMVQHCGDEFDWTPAYDFVKESDQGKSRSFDVQFIGITRFQMRDTATIRIVVKDALNYPLTLSEYNQVVKNMKLYVLQLKYTFLQLDRRLKKTKTVRTGFDLTSASTSLTGTIMSTSADPDAQRTGKILPSVGLALVPIKEASVPSKVVDQNQAAQIRTSIKRLEYMLQDNQLVGERDPDIARKTAKLKDELKQVQVQLIEVPIDFTNDMTEEELNKYFNSPSVNKKYRLSRK
ncbi:MAG: hypothetical protein ACO1OO_08940 [Flavisolibacter sp.]